MPYTELQPLLDQNTWVLKSSYETHRTFVSQTTLTIEQLKGKGILSSPYIQNYEYIHANHAYYLDRIKKKNLLYRTETQLILRDEKDRQTTLSATHAQLIQFDEMLLTTYSKLSSTLTLTLFDLHRIQQIVQLSDAQLPTPVVNSFHSPERVKRLWSIINPPQYPLLTSPFAWLTLELPNEKLSDAEMTEVILQFYREKRRLLIDPFNSIFKIKDLTQTTLIVCDDVITAWPRGFVIDNFEQQQVNELQLMSWYETTKTKYPATVNTLKCLFYLEEYHVAQNMDNCYLDQSTLSTLSQLQSENAPMSDVNLEIFICLRDTGILADLTPNNRAALYANLAKHKYPHALMYIVTYEPNYTAIHLEQQKNRLNRHDFKIYLETINSTQRTALIHAASLGHEDAVTALLAQGANINARTIHQHTALLLAVNHQFVEIVRHLCSHPEIDITLRSDQNCNALDLAIDHLDFFLERHKTNPSSTTTLAIQQRHQSIIDLLLTSALKLSITQQQSFLSKIGPAFKDILEYIAYCYDNDDYYRLSEQLTEDHHLYTKHQYILKVTVFLNQIGFYSFLAFLKKTVTDCKNPQQKEALSQLYQQLNISRLVFLQGTNIMEQIHLFQSNCKTHFAVADENLINKHYYWSTGISSLFEKNEKNTFRTYYQTTKKSWTANLEQLAPRTFLS